LPNCGLAPMSPVMPSARVVEEVRRIVDTAKAREVTLRTLGAAAFMIHCPGHLRIHSATGREISDIDLVGYKKQGSEICNVMSELGYELDRKMLIHEDRYFFSDPRTRIKADIFLDKLEMCHTIDFSGRLERDYPTVPLEELLLEKLQIVELESKDIIDVAMLLSDHDAGSGKGETIDKAYVAKLLADDWGFYYTVTTNLSKISQAVEYMAALEKSDKKRIGKNIELIHAEIVAYPKSLAWKLRARVGPKTKWYRDVSNPTGAY
jgi:hypothetical protein